MLNLKIYAIIAAVVIAAGLSFKLYFDYSQEQIATLTRDIQSYKIQNEAQQLAYNTAKDNLAKQSQDITELNNKLIKIDIRTGKLSKTLARHELDKLASGKPGLIKNLANRATVKVLDNLQKASQPVEKK